MIYQAEDAEMHGAQLATDWSGFTGAGFWNPLNASGDWAEWTIDGPTAGTHSLLFRYANGGTGDRPLDLTINGQHVLTSPFPVTGGWSNWEYEVVYADLAAGVNTVRVTNTGARGPNIDYLGVNAGEVTIPDPVPVDALTAVDTGLHRSVTLIGNQTSEEQEVNLELVNIPAELVRDDSVRVRATLLTNSEALTAPPVVLDEDIDVTADGARVALTLPGDAAHRIDVMPAVGSTEPFRVEIEDLEGRTSSGATVHRLDESGASNNAATLLDTTDDGQGVVYSVQVPEDGVYHLSLGGKKAESHGIAQVYVDDTAVGGPVDQYGTETYAGAHIGIVELTTGTHEIEFRAVGTHPVSSGRALVLDYLEFSALSEDGEDPACADPDQRETVVVGGVDSGVPNRTVGNGCTINDLILDEQSWPNKGAFMRHVRDVTDELVERAVIDERERSAIMRAAGKARI
nr:carbohydrate-binding protein [Phytoactinopolyspora alkaliphila]